MTRNTQKRGIWSSGWSEILIRMNLITWVQFPAAIYIADFCLVRKKSKRAPEKISTSVLLNIPKPSIVWITSNCGNFVKMGIPDHLTCLLRSLYAGQEATVRTRHGKTDWSQIKKGIFQVCILSPCVFNFYAEYIMRYAGLDEAQAGIKISGRNINNLRYAWYHTYGKNHLVGSL